MRKVIIGRVGYDVIKYKVNLEKDHWANCIPCSIRIKMNINDYLMLKCFVVSDDNFNFNSVEDDGIYSCVSTMNTMMILSKFPNGDAICKFDLIIWEKNKLSKSESRDTILDDVLGI